MQTQVKSQTDSTVYTPFNQSSYAALMCLLLCVTLNIQLLTNASSFERGFTTITAGRATNEFDEAVHRASSGFLSKKSSTTIDHIATSDAVGSNFEGAVVSLNAGNNVNITAQTNTRDETHYAQTKKSGLELGTYTSTAVLGMRQLKSLRIK